MMASDERVTLVSSEHEHWTRLAARMATLISEHLGPEAVEHIGSTAVPGMPAKPVVDLAVGVPAERVLRSAKKLASCGFDLEGELPGHAWLSYPDRSARSFVIHVFDVQGAEWGRRLRFRDILIAEDRQRAKYLAVKHQAAAVAEGWGEYTRAKAAVVAEILGDSAHPEG